MSCQNSEANQNDQLQSISESEDAQSSSGGKKKRCLVTYTFTVGWSFDAFIYNVRTTPDDAYRYAKGEAIDIPGVGQISPSRPLDFAASYRSFRVYGHHDGNYT